jgi:hypothetical protein
MMCKILRGVTIPLVFAVLTSCASAPIIYEMRPPTHAGQHLEVTPWFGSTAILIEVRNTSDATVTILDQSFVLVSPFSEARYLEASLQSPVIPPDSYTNAFVNGLVRFDLDAESYVTQQLGQISYASTGLPETDTQRLERMNSYAGETIRLRFTYVVAGDSYEEIIEFTIAGARALEDISPNAGRTEHWGYQTP